MKLKSARPSKRTPYYFHPKEEEKTTTDISMTKEQSVEKYKFLLREKSKEFDKWASVNRTNLNENNEEFKQRKQEIKRLKLKIALFSEKNQ